MQRTTQQSQQYTDKEKWEKSLKNLKNIINDYNNLRTQRFSNNNIEQLITKNDRLNRIISINPDEKIKEIFSKQDIAKLSQPEKDLVKQITGPLQGILDQSYIRQKRYVLTSYYLAEIIKAYHELFRNTISYMQNTFTSRTSENNSVLQHIITILQRHQSFDKSDESELNTVLKEAQDIINNSDINKDIENAVNRTMASMRGGQRSRHRQ